MLWMFQRVFTGVPTGDNAKLKDVSIREIVVVAPLLALSLFIGLYPKPVIDRVEPTVERVIPNFRQRTDYKQPKQDVVHHRIREKADGPRRRAMIAASIAAPGIKWDAIAPVIVWSPRR